ncbi:Tim44 domain-containing protein [Clostridium sp. 'White wine YQ']|uniref:Tim44 domain-containing protein n=1 Tax=Clostridium sp. 'White wine YQ' TaxID=3027474 RepID=UPI002366D362|nr:Tim44-like domain-containing protein [Clostridium sp. 'White wine YQ']MDD7795467.1 Tim44-like domain-containing protein [Clostridium sp. 'White wine YQ']
MKKYIRILLIIVVVFITFGQANNIEKSTGRFLNQVGIQYTVYDYDNVKADVGNNNNQKKTPSSKAKSSSSKSTTSSKSKKSFIGGGLSIGAIVLIGIVLLIVFVLKRKGAIKQEDIDNFKDFLNDENREREISPSVRQEVVDNTVAIRNEIIKMDPLFSPDKFIGWSQEVFVSLQEAWTSRDWAKIRPFEKEELFRMHELQLQEYKRMHRINVVERISVNQSYLFKYVRDVEYEYLTVYLHASMNDYIIDEDTRKIVKGDDETRFTNKYLLTFMRNVGVKTDPATSNMSTKQCPHCGAPIQVTSAGKCEYCDFIVTTGEHDWVLSDLDCINEDTQVGNGGVFIN